MILSFLLLKPDLVNAEGNIHVGQLRIHPFLSARSTVSDNIFFTSTEERRDSYATYMPGLKLELPMRLHKAEAEYYALATRYETYGTEDTTDHSAKGMVNLKFGRLFEARFSDVFLKGHEGRSESSTGFIQTFRNNSVTAALVYQLMKRSKVEFSFSRSNWDFIERESGFRNRDEDLFSGFLYYRFLPKTSALIAVEQKVVQYETETDLDSSSDSAQLGLAWDISENSRGTIQAGYLNKDFGSSLQRDYSDWVGSIDLKHQFSRHASVELIGRRTVQEASVRNTRYFIRTGAYAEFSFRIYSKLAAQARASYGREEFSDEPGTPQRDDKTAMGGGGLKYSIRDWLEIEARYSSRKRTSSVPVNDFIENSYTFSAGAVF